ncbi:hypothetical protein A9Q81_10150 [Gammaproteobacteria bacterium 42_54_T18]|nr:hypothetical protein A9Q81_10150 [Gammaproteobacteria bacterium 42_54_T18]
MTTCSQKTQPQDIIQFWFEEIAPKQWWIKDNEFDQLLIDSYQGVLDFAVKGELFSWRETALGRLAEIIVLDQFSRNIYRDDARAFAADPMALVLSQEAVRQQSYKGFTSNQKQFLFMPYMHSESLIVHEEAVKLFSEPGLEGNLEFEHKHRVIIQRFGRYPHRNEILGRVSTDEEKVFLLEPGSSF